MLINKWQDNWNELGKEDPLWVVLTDPSRKDGKWKPAEFFATGQLEVSEVMARAAEVHPTLQKGKALDFGCGVGRLSQALAAHFDEVYGVDISPSMIGHAVRFNQFPDRCRFHVNGSERLELFPDASFDLIYSNIVLQHIEPQYSKQYIAEFVRLLKPGGLLVFQILSATLLRRLVPDALVEWYRAAKNHGGAFIGMFGVPQSEVLSILDQAGGRILASEAWPNGRRWISHRHFVTKP
jgi:ubiquinone/menaquinone biosynthesis C-methylase UbiE